MKARFALAIMSVLSIGSGAAQAFVVEYWADNEPRVLQSAPSAPPQTRSYSLDDLPLVETEPAVLHLGKEAYVLNQEGLYRIRKDSSSKVIRQSILYRGNVWRFAGHLSRVYVYGTRHLGETQAQWDEHVRYGEPLSLQCGYISMFVHHHLTEQKIPSRLVGCATGSNWKHYDDGHALMEICDPTDRRWVLFDPTLGARFKEGGHWLNLLEATRLYRAGGRADRVEFLNAGQKIDPLTDYESLYAKYIANKAELSAFVQQFKPLLQNDLAVIHAWYGRVMQIPIIDNWFVPESDSEDALLRTIPSWKNLVRLTTSEFSKRYYDLPCCEPRNAADAPRQSDAGQQTQGARLKLVAVPIPVHSYRLLSMSMDDEGDIWAGAIHHVIHRYDPRRGQVENFPIPYEATAASCICAGKKVYILAQKYSKLIIYDRQLGKFSEAAYPSNSPNVWYGTKTDGDHYLYLFDRESSGVIKWDTQSESGSAIPYPFKTIFPAGGIYEPRDKAIWCFVVNLTDDLYAPIGLARLDVRTDRFTDFYPWPKDDAGLEPYQDSEHTIFRPYTLRGKIVPFDFKLRRFCKFLDVPGYGKEFGFMGGPVEHQGRYYFSISNYNGDDKAGCDGKPYHFCNGILEFDPKSRTTDILKLETKDSYNQVAYMLSAGGQFYATGTNIQEADGSLNRDRKGEVLFWQTLQPEPGGK